MSAQALTWTDLDSTNVAAAAYIPDKEIIAVRFKSGSLYSYHDADPEHFDGLVGAISAGDYMNKVIKVLFPVYKKWDSEAELLNSL